MNWCRLISAPLPARVLVTWMLVCAHVLSVVGVPVVPQRVRKDHSRAYPCMDRPCGCVDYDECWAGDCCCFTLEQKLAWAAANQIAPPTCAVQAAERAACCEAKPIAPACPHCEKTTTCCETKQPSVKWVNGVSLQKCKGLTVTTFQLISNGGPPVTPFVYGVDWFVCEWNSLQDLHPDCQFSPPDSPPPRS